TTASCPTTAFDTSARSAPSASLAASAEARGSELTDLPFDVVHVACHGDQAVVVRGRRPVQRLEDPLGVLAGPRGDRRHHRVGVGALPEPEPGRQPVERARPQRAGGPAPGLPGAVQPAAALHRLGGRPPDGQPPPPDGPGPPPPPDRPPRTAQPGPSRPQPVVP